MAIWIPTLKSLIKISVDNYVLPGTTSGTAILWLYLIQWKRDMSAITFAVLYMVFAHNLILQRRKRNSKG